MLSIKFNYWLGLFGLFFLVTGCASSKQARSMKHTINGTWVLQAISFQGMSSKNKVFVFNEADVNCFKGSTWKFVANNSMGTYELSNADGCTSVVRNIRWSVYEPKNEEKKLQFKRLDSKKKSVDDNDGFRLTISSITDTNMQLISTVNFEGTNAAIVYNFVKN